MSKTTNADALELARMLRDGDAQDSGSQREIAAHIERLVEENERLTKLPTTRTVVVNAGALQMVINALRRDAAEGRVARGEMADQLIATSAPAPVGIPDGFVAVPVHATDDMVEAAEDVEDLRRRGTPGTWKKVYRAMIANAPSAW